MEYRTLHPWEVSPQEAVAIQQRLRSQVRVEPLDARTVELVAGADLAFDRNSDTAYAGIVVLRLPSMEVVAQVGVQAETTFPYVPGLLSFRETPPLLKAWEQLKVKPEALICDGHGQAHPRRFGIACHLGLVFDVPTIGCAKSILVGHHGPLAREAGSYTALRDGGEVIGAALRTREGVSPVYVSIGHRVDLKGALELVMRCIRRTRVPETTRQAHLLVNALRQGEEVSLRNGREQQGTLF
ncbi:MAG TPA: deoxyribonuclease V [Armatimonadetes bacterium]|nr:deoxyribonuclease V [Armatimonadota bacterium]